MFYQMSHTSNHEKQLRSVGKMQSLFISGLYFNFSGLHILSVVSVHVL